MHSSKSKRHIGVKETYDILCKTIFSKCVCFDKNVFNDFRTFNLNKRFPQQGQNVQKFNLGKFNFSKQICLKKQLCFRQFYNTFEWTAEFQKRHDEIKKLICEQFLNIIIDPNQPLYGKYFASHLGIGTALLQYHQVTNKKI